MADESERTKLLQEITRRIRATTVPERIILFGSYARGDEDADSDLDLLVVVRDARYPRRESTRIRRALRGLLVPIDVIVATPEQVDRYADSIGLVYRAALQEGVVLYARASGLTRPLHG